MDSEKLKSRIKEMIKQEQEQIKNDPTVLIRQDYMHERTMKLLSELMED